MWLKLIQNPILFQGRNKHNAYFEGWYFKQGSPLYQDKPFSIQIGENHFSEDGLFISLVNKEIKVKGQINFESFRGIETTLLNPNIMGIFAYIPKMECNHGIVNMTHRLKGSLELNEVIITLENRVGEIIFHGVGSQCGIELMPDGGKLK